MSELEDKEKDLNKLKAKADALLKSNHPASDKIEVKTDPVIRSFRPLLSLNTRPLFFQHRHTGILCRHSGVGSCRLLNALTLISRRMRLIAR